MWTSIKKISKYENGYPVCHARLHKKLVRVLLGFRLGLGVRDSVGGPVVVVTSDTGSSTVISMSHGNRPSLNTTVTRSRAISLIFPMFLSSIKWSSFGISLLNMTLNVFHRWFVLLHLLRNTDQTQVAPDAGFPDTDKYLCHPSPPDSRPWAYFSECNWSPFLLLVYWGPLSRVVPVCGPSPNLA